MYVINEIKNAWLVVSKLINITKVMYKYTRELNGVKINLVLEIIETVKLYWLFA